MKLHTPKNLLPSFGQFMNSTPLVLVGQALYRLMTETKITFGDSPAKPTPQAQQNQSKPETKLPDAKKTNSSPAAAAKPSISSPNSFSSRETPKPHYASASPSANPAGPSSRINTSPSSGRGR